MLLGSSVEAARSTLPPPPEDHLVTFTADGAVAYVPPVRPPSPPEDHLVTFTAEGAVAYVPPVKPPVPPLPLPGHRMVAILDANGALSYVNVKADAPAKDGGAQAADPTLSRPSRWGGRTPDAVPKDTLSHVRPPPPKIPAEFAKQTLRPRGPTAPPSTSSSGMRHQGEGVPGKRPETAYSALPSGPRGGPPPRPPGSADLGTRVRGTPGGGSSSSSGSLAATIS